MLLGVVVRLAAGGAIVFGAYMAYRHLIATSPRARRATPPRQARLVQVVELDTSEYVVKVKQNGKVLPAQQVTLQPQVSGKIVEICEDLMPGTAVKAGQKLIAIDRRDYDILVRQRYGDVVKAERDLKVEKGNQEIAKQEYELLGDVISEQDRELVLREPQLAAAQAAYESAKAAHEKAKLDLARCDINAPFDAIVEQRHIDLGATVSANTPLVTLIATDQAWVEVKVPIGQLKWLTIPRANGQTGSRVTLRNPLAWGRGRIRTGRVLRLHGDLEPQGQMAKLLVVVDDPFCLRAENNEQPKLLMDSYVSAEIEGLPLRDVFEIDRSDFHENDTVWIMNENNELDIRSVQAAYRGTEKVYIAGGLAVGEKLVTTNIAAPVAGMLLRLDGGSDEPNRPEAGDRSGPPVQNRSQAGGRGRQS